MLGLNSIYDFIAPFLHLGKGIINLRSYGYSEAWNKYTHAHTHTNTHSHLAQGMTKSWQGDISYN